tara:strand:- start:664 stop:903 length:240 start_codon:yes stop_codon:yes gene_type:complete
MTLNLETKLTFALEHIAHLHDLIEDNEYEHFLNDHLTTLEYEMERQLKNEQHRKANRPIPPRVQRTPEGKTIETSNRNT